jgi:hypothetical protein
MPDEARATQQTLSAGKHCSLGRKYALAAEQERQGQKQGMNKCGEKHALAAEQERQRLEEYMSKCRPGRPSKLSCVSGDHREQHAAYNLAG